MIASRNDAWNCLPMSDTPKTFERPMSPHLQVYRLPMTALMSISHRITGVILSGGMLLVAAFLIAAVMGRDYYDLVMSYARTPPGFWFFIAWAFALYYHMCNGIRHMIWDTVHLLELRQANAAGWVVLIVSAALTAATWYYAVSN